MTLSELIESVQDAIQDDGYTSTVLTTLINRTIKKIARGVAMPGKYSLSPPLPSLYTAGDVETTATGIISLPPDYSRPANMVVDSDGKLITIKDSFRDFIKVYGRELNAGSPYICTFYGKRLFFRDVPAAAETLTVHYYKNPEPLEDDADEPEDIPEELQDELIVSDVAGYIYNLIEDGMDGQKVNTQNYLNRFNAGLFALELLLGEDGEPIEYDDDSAGYIP